MVVVCSDDGLLVDVCNKIFGSESEVKQLHDVTSIGNGLAANDDLLVIDLQDFNEEELPEIKCPAVALTDIPVYDQAMRLLQIGVRGYGNRHMHPENFLQAATAVRSGQVWLPPDIIARMISTIPRNGSHKEEPLMEPLSKREKEVAHLVTEGLSNKEIADALHVSVRTVKAHLTSIFAKTGYRDRLELAVKMKR